MIKKIENARHVRSSQVVRCFLAQANKTAKRFLFVQYLNGSNIGTTVKITNYMFDEQIKSFSKLLNHKYVFYGKWKIVSHDHAPKMFANIFSENQRGGSEAWGIYLYSPCETSR